MAFSRALTADEERWLRCFRAMAAAGREAVAPLAGRAEGRVPLGRGSGGDITVELDRAAEEAMVGVLAAAAPAPYCLVAEERGVEDRAGAEWRVMLDPVDGSLNAKRGLEPFGTTIAAALGGTLADVRVAYTSDYTRGHEFAAVKGAGLADLGGPHGPGEGETAARRADAGEAAPDTSVELLLFEGGRPDQLDFPMRHLAALSVPEPNPFLRVRQIGSLALCLCHVAQGVADVLLAPVPARAVDIAGGLLILAESGGGAVALDGVELLGNPLDLERRSPFVAWRRGLPGEAIAARARTYFGGTSC